MSNELKPLHFDADYTMEEALAEAKRCLNCESPNSQANIAPFVYEYSPYSCKDCIETEDTVTAILRGIFTYISMHVY